MAVDRPLLGALAVLVRDGHVLLARRGKEPDKGLWGFPGGHVELGETALEAAVRELHEETGVKARALSYLTNIDVVRHHPDGSLATHYLLAAVDCELISGTPRAVDEILEAAWISVDTVVADDLPMSARVAELTLLALSRDQDRRDEKRQNMNSDSR